MKTGATILCIGGSGFIGTNLIRYLLSKKYFVHNLDIAENRHFSQSNNYQFHRGSFIHHSLLEQIIKTQEVDVVISLAANVYPGDIFSLEEKNSVITESLSAHGKLLELLKTYAVGKYVYFSSGGTVYGRNGIEVNKETDPLYPISFYGYMKVLLEKFIMMECAEQCGYLIVRPSNPYGYFQNFFGRQGLISVILGKIMRNEPVAIWGDGMVVRDYVFIDDVINQLGALMETDCSNEIVNIGSGMGHTVRQVLDICAEVTGVKPDVRYESARKTDIPHSVLNIDKLQNIIGNYQSTPLETGVQYTWEWAQRTI